MLHAKPTPKRGDSILGLIGNTPLIPLHFGAENRTIWAKCEFLNPSGSIKDRLARTVVLDAEARRVLNSDITILECTSGNTGIAGGFIPPLLRGVEIDGACKVSIVEALEMTLRLNREFGLLVGSSSGANMAVAVQQAVELGPHSIVVTILCDRAERYFGTRLFESHQD